MQVIPVDRTEVPPFTMPARFRTDIAYFMTPAGESDGATVMQSEVQTDSTYTRTQALTFDGGCVMSTVVVPSQFDRGLVIADVDAALVLVPRSALDAQVRAQTDGKLGLDP